MLNKKQLKLILHAFKTIKIGIFFFLLLWNFRKDGCQGWISKLYYVGRMKSLTSECVGVVTSNPLQGLVHQDDGHRELHDDHPLVNAEGGDVEDNVEEVNVQDHEVEGEGQGHGHQQPDVAPWRHKNKGLVLRDGVQCVGHLNGDEDGQSHGHGLRSMENLAGDALEVLWVRVAGHVVGQLPEGHLGAGRVVQEPVGSTANGGSTDIGTNG